MKIQKGIVKYKDRDDIVCTYGVTDSGNTYYFIDLEDSKLSNGNIVASTELVEAIDPMFKAKHVGVIDSAGKEVIPFIHRAIKPITEDILLAEMAEPVSESVKEANRMKSDPALAAKLVSTPAVIKDKLNGTMGSEGRYIFNDQFSEATLYDVNGNNLINKECYSFIGMAGGKIYFSKNTPESEVFEYSMLPPEVQSSVAPVEGEQEINVSQVQVPSDIVENALEGTTAPEAVGEVQPIAPPIVEETPVENPVIPTEEVVAPETEAVATEEVTVPETEAVPTELEGAFANAEVPVDGSVTLEETVGEQTTQEAPVEEAAHVEGAPVEATEEAVETESTTVEEVPVEESVPVENTQEAPVDESVSGEVVEESTPLEAVQEESRVEESTTEEAQEVDNTVVEEAPVEESAPVETVEDSDEDFVESSIEGVGLEETPNNEIDDSDDEEIDMDGLDTAGTTLDDLFHTSVDEDDDDRFMESVIHEDTIEEDDFDDMGYSESTESSDIMTNVASSIKALMKQNKTLKESVKLRDEKLAAAVASRKTITEKARMQEKKIGALAEKIHREEVARVKLEKKVQSLEAQKLDLERTVEKMKSQIHGEEGLMKLLADVQTVLGDEEDYSSHKKAA